MTTLEPFQVDLMSLLFQGLMPDWGLGFGCGTKGIKASSKREILLLSLATTGSQTRQKVNEKCQTNPFGFGTSRGTQLGAHGLHIFYPM